MGASSSKTAQTAARSSKIRSFPSTPSSATRQSITRPAPPQPLTQAEPAQVYTPLQASSTKSDSINLDAKDPVFAARLQKLGIVQPNPFIPLSQQPHSTSNNSQPTDVGTSGPGRGVYQPPQAVIPPDGDGHGGNANGLGALDQNPALLVLRAREALQRQYDAETEEGGAVGKKGRSFVDVGSLREAVRLRGNGVPEREIEKKFGLVSGAMGRVGGRGVVDVVR